MSHLHKNRLAQVNNVVPDTDPENERDPKQTAKTLNAAMTATQILPGERPDDEGESEPPLDSDGDEDDDGDDDDSSEESDDAAKNPEDMTKDEIRALLDEKDIEYTSKATKAELLALWPKD